MTNLREAAQQALEALEEYQSKGAPFLACDGAIDALRAALAQQAEPVPVTLPEGYEPHELPADYTGKLWIEGQVRALVRTSSTQSAPSSGHME